MGGLKVCYFIFIFTFLHCHLHESAKKQFSMDEGIKYTHYGASLPHIARGGGLSLTACESDFRPARSRRLSRA